MFQSYKYIGAIYNTFKYIIIDSEFEESVVVEGSFGTDIIGVMHVKAAEVVYKRRAYTDKQIAKQLFLCMQYCTKFYPLNDIVSRNKRSNPELWKKYGEHIKLFLLFT